VGGVQALAGSSGRSGGGGGIGGICECNVGAQEESNYYNSSMYSHGWTVWTHSKRRN